MQRHRKLVLALGTAGFILAPTAASAQNDIPLTVSPSGTAPVQPAQPASAAGAGTTYSQPAVDAPAAGGEGEAVEETGFYHYDDYDDYVDERETLGTTGPAGGVPELHVVRSGDTLWDICGYYFSNPWEWPKVWSYNPSITNPHWIYPGDVVRLQLATMKAAGPAGDEPTPEPIAARVPTSMPSSGIRLRQLAFIEDEDLESSFVIGGSEEERVMLSQNDVVYVEYGDGKPPQVGRRYAIYSETEKVVHPGPKRKGEVVGAYVRVLGELEVLSVKKDKRARAVIREGTDVIERGHRVGPLQRTFQQVEDKPNAENRIGTIVSQLGTHELIGAHQMMVIDLGEGAGVVPGNRMYIVRRGDAMPDRLDRRVGDDDRRFPAYAIGEVLIVQVGKSTSVGVVTLSVQEFEVGDHVLMRKAR